MAFRQVQRLVAAGSRAPDFRLPSLEGGEESLAGLVAGGPALLAFFKISCPVCQLTLPFLSRIHSPGRLAVIGVSQDDAKHTRDFNRSFGVSFPTLLDAEKARFPVSNAFGIASVPTLVLVEAPGTVVRVVEGWSKKDVDWLAGRAGVPVFRQGEYVPEWKSG